jgi:DNA-binding MarR family transcriptional regulator
MKDLIGDPGFLLSRTSGLVVRATNGALAPYGLRVRQYSVLVLACDAIDGISQRDLAQTLGLDPSQVVVLIDELAEAGLVERRTAPTDRRANLVVATDRGRSIRGCAAERAAEAMRDRLRPLGDDEQETLKELLSRVVLSALTKA